MAMLLLAGMPLAGIGARAEPLDKESCAKLEAESKALFDREMKEALDLGPDWVKNNLSEEKIERIRHFLGVEEQIQFRCRKDGFPAGAGIKPMEMPDRNPVRLAAEKDAGKPSQTVADSDKTPPNKAKATR
jgi:hypothetical protein